MHPLSNSKSRRKHFWESLPAAVVGLSKEISTAMSQKLIPCAKRRHPSRPSSTSSGHWTTCSAVFHYFSTDRHPCQWEHHKPRLHLDRKELYNAVYSWQRKIFYLIFEWIFEMTKQEAAIRTTEPPTTWSLVLARNGTSEVNFSMFESLAIDLRQLCFNW